MDLPKHFDLYRAQIRRMDPSSHKGQNGKVLLIGGSELFHAASRWSLDVVSAMVDMVFYSSVPENNELIYEAKHEFWDGVVVPRGKVEDYLQEADVILIGPGMTRDTRTQELTNHLILKYPEKKWVIDAGALQMMNPTLLNNKCIITPHHEELELVLSKIGNDREKLLKTGATVLLKGKLDLVMRGVQRAEVGGGNSGMTKGGTGDALAGLIAGLYAFSDDPFAVGVVASFVNKRAGDKLYAKVGPFFKTSELVKEIPVVLKEVLGY